MKANDYGRYNIGGEEGMRHFNTEGVCRPEEHYLVRLDDRLAVFKLGFTADAVLSFD